MNSKVRVVLSLEFVRLLSFAMSRFAHGGSGDSGPPVVRAAKFKCRGGIGRAAPARSVWGGARGVCRRRPDRSGYLRETCAFLRFLMPDITGLLIPTPSGGPTAPRL